LRGRKGRGHLLALGDFGRVHTKERNQPLEEQGQSGITQKGKRHRGFFRQESDCKQLVLEEGKTGMEKEEGGDGGAQFKRRLFSLLRTKGGEKNEGKN